MNNRDKIKEAIEKAMARIGCPPGDNADADLYRELQAAIALLDAEDQGTGEVVAWLSKTTGDMVLAEDRAGQMGSHDAYEDFTIPLYRHPPAQGKVLRMQELKGRQN